MNCRQDIHRCQAQVPVSCEDNESLTAVIPEVELPAPICSTFRLTCSSVLIGAVTACAMALAVATDRWLFTQEPYQFTQKELDIWNITDRNKIPKISVKVRSGLWRVCTIDIEASSDLCISIDYSQEGSGRLYGAPTCMAIVGAIRYSSPAFVTALVFVALATILLFIGSVQRSYKTLFASVLYVTTGLSLAIGIILYISAVNDEVGYSTNKSTYKKFHYHYGSSFYCACLAFLTAEGSAVLSALQFLRIKTQTQNLADVVPGLEEHLVSSTSRSSIREYHGLTPSNVDNDNVTYYIDTSS